MAKGRNCFAKEKKTIIFDEDSRREYLLGFQKRKNKRRQKALDDLKKKEKEKIKEIKKKKKEEFMEHLKKQREELDALESDKEENPEDDTSPVDATYDHPEHIVTVTTVCDVNLEESSTTIGYNKGLPEMKNSADSNVNKEKAKNKLFEKKIKKYNKTNKSQHKRSNNNKSTKFQPKKKRKK